MGLFDDHAGIWCGTHIVTDSHGRPVDQYDTTVIGRREGEKWRQTMTRAWPDGRTVEVAWWGTFEGPDVLRYDDPSMQGRARVISERDIVSIWHDPAAPDATFTAIITLLSPDRRIRTIQRIEGHRLVGRTLVQESRARSAG